MANASAENKACMNSCILVYGVCKHSLHEYRGGSFPLWKLYIKLNAIVFSASFWSNIVIIGMYRGQI